MSPSITRRSEEGRPFRKHLGRLAGLALAGGLVMPALAHAQDEILVVDVSGEAPMELGAIVITASGFEQNITDAPASISVVPGEDIRNERFTDLTDALNGVQGVVTTGVANEKDIFIRGLPGEYTLILVDGRRQGTRESRANGSSGFEQSFIPPAGAIDRIEIVRGPMSSLYGSDAMGGVINIITKPVAEEWSGEISTSLNVPGDGDFGSDQTLSFYASGPLINEKLGLQIWGRRSDRDKSSIPGAENEANEYDLTGRLSFALAPDHTFYAELGTTKIDSIDQDALRFREHSRNRAAIGYAGQIGGWNVAVNLQKEVGERKTFERAASTGAYLEDIRSPEIENTVLAISGSRQISFAGMHTLTLGYQKIDAKLTDQNPGTGITTDQIFEIGQQALYLENEWRISPTFALTGGLRLNHHDEYNGNWTPRLYAVWNATNALTFKGGVSTGFKAPDLREVAPGYLYTTGGRGCVLDPTAAQACGVIIGDPDLKAETSINYELGVLYETAELSLGATYFHNELKDKIDNARVYNADGSFAVYPGDPRYTLFYHYNIGEARIKGVELTADWRATDRLSLRGTYTFTDSKQLNGNYAGLPLARTPKHLANIRLDYQTKIDGLGLWGVATYHGSEINAGLRVGDDGTPVTNGAGDIVGRKYDPYALVDIGLNYGVTDTVTLNAAVYNVLNKTIDADAFGTVGAGRSFWVGATARF